MPLSETFASTSVTVTHDHAGNLIDDGVFVYQYDAWNRLVLIRSSVDADITIQTAEFDAVGRRMKKVVTSSGDLDGTTVYFYCGSAGGGSATQICETRDGSGNMVAQFIHGTRYIDELVMMRAASKGDLYIHQDANYNAIGLTDLGGNLIERYVLTPYGELTVQQLSSYGDRDGDGDVDAADKGTPGTTCTGTVTAACRVLDLDFDGDYDASDATLFDNLDAGDAVHPGRRFSALGQPFGHQGLWFDAEAGQYQNRARWYGPSMRRFAQRDLLKLDPGPRVRRDAGVNLYAYVASDPERDVNSGSFGKNCQDRCIAIQSMAKALCLSTCCPNKVIGCLRKVDNKGMECLADCNECGDNDGPECRIVTGNYMFEVLRILFACV